MGAEHWRQISDLYHAALDRQPSERPAFLAEACLTDAALRSEIELLLTTVASPGAAKDPSSAPAGAGRLGNVPVAGGRLGCYVIDSLLGAGGMGVVYKARDTRLDRDVAIKILPSADLDRRARFEREAKAIAAIQHPHICTLFDLGHADGIDYLVLEYIEGETLTERLLRGPLPVDSAMETAAEIADVLDRVHRAGVIHRDLKPSNIMLTKTGVKVLDFGLAKLSQAPLATGTTTSAAALTVRGAIVGTLPYMAPEQLEGRPVDHRIDIWALGCILYESINGSRPFEEDNQAAVIGAILHKNPKPLSAVQSLVPRALERVVGKCLSKDPDHRWQTARDLLDEIRWVRETMPSGSADASPPEESVVSRTYEVGVVKKRRRRFVFRISIGITLSALIATGVWRETRRAETSVAFESVATPIQTDSSGPVPQADPSPLPAAAPPPLATPVLPNASSSGAPRIPMALSLETPPEQDGLPPLPGELQRDYDARVKAMRERYQEAVGALSSGSYQRADELFGAIIRDVMTDRYMDTGTLWLQAKDGLKQMALRIYNDAIDLEKREEWDKAIAELRRAHDTDPGTFTVDNDIKRVTDKKLAAGQKLCNEGRTNFPYPNRNAEAQKAYEEVIRLLPANHECVAEAKARLPVLRAK